MRPRYHARHLAHRLIPQLVALALTILYAPVDQMEVHLGMTFRLGALTCAVGLWRVWRSADRWWLEQGAAGVRSMCRLSRST